MKKSLAILLLAFPLINASEINADIVANYDFANVLDADETTTTFSSASIDSSAISVASDITSPSTHNGGAVNPEFGDVYDNGGNQAIGWSARGNRPAQTFGIVNPIDTYFLFDNTSASGALTYETLTVGTGVFTTLNGTTTAYDYTLSFSLDGASFTEVSTIASGVGAGEAATVTGAGTNSSAISFDLSSIGSQAGTVFFQLDPIATSGAAENGVQAQRAGFIDNVQLNASAVPEPTSTVVLLGGFLGLVARRRRA